MGSLQVSKIQTIKNLKIILLLLSTITRSTKVYVLRLHFYPTKSMQSMNFRGLCSWAPIKIKENVIIYLQDRRY